MTINEVIDILAKVDKDRRLTIEHYKEIAENINKECKEKK